MYSPLILNNSNWRDFHSRLYEYPIRMSKLNMLESSISVKSISMKYVLRGKEVYNLGANSYELTDNQFLITNKFSDCNVRINEKNTSTGICIDLNEMYFSDILTSIYYPNEIDCLNLNNMFFLSNDIFIQGIHASGTMKSMLQALAEYAESGREMCFKDDFLRNISFEIILSQQRIIKEYNRISVIKQSTKKALYTRLLMAKNIIRDNLNIRFSVGEIANKVTLSEFRLHHLFKEVFGITPLKYQTKLRMEYAKQLHAKGKTTWTEIALRLGYPDVHTFSKVFKKLYGKSPASRG